MFIVKAGKTEVARDENFVSLVDKIIADLQEKTRCGIWVEAELVGFAYITDSILEIIVMDDELYTTLKQGENPSYKFNDSNTSFRIPLDSDRETSIRYSVKDDPRILSNSTNLVEAIVEASTSLAHNKAFAILYAGESVIGTLLTKSGVIQVGFTDKKYNETAFDLTYKGFVFDGEKSVWRKSMQPHGNSTFNIKVAGKIHPLNSTPDVITTISEGTQINFF